MEHVFSDSSVETFEGKQNVWKGISDFLVGNTYSVYPFRKKSDAVFKDIFNIGARSPVDSDGV